VIIRSCSCDILLAASYLQNPSSRPAALKIIDCSLFPENSPTQPSTHQYWTPVVANHFPPTSPFVQNQAVNCSLLPNTYFSPSSRVPLPIQQPPVTRQRSGDSGGDYTLLPQSPKLERKRSRKGAREVH